MIKVLVVDHHPIVRKGIYSLFETSPEIQIVAALDNGKELFDYITKNPVDVIVTEMDLPGLNGITILRTLKKEFTDAKVLIFSSHPEEVYAVTTIKAGASGYLSKSADTETIKEAILKVHNGGIYISNQLAQRLAFDETGRRPGKSFKKLSTREVEVLKLLTAGRKNKEVAKELEINEKTVSTYKARLMRKLNVTNIVDLINRAKHLDLNG